MIEETRQFSEVLLKYGGPSLLIIAALFVFIVWQQIAKDRLVREIVGKYESLLRDNIRSNDHLADTVLARR